MCDAAGFSVRPEENRMYRSHVAYADCLVVFELIESTAKGVKPANRDVTRPKTKPRPVEDPTMDEWDLGVLNDLLSLVVTLDTEQGFPDFTVDYPMDKQKWSVTILNLERVRFDALWSMRVLLPTCVIWVLLTDTQRGLRFEFFKGRHAKRDAADGPTAVSAPKQSRT